MKARVKFESTGADGCRRVQTGADGCRRVGAASVGVVERLRGLVELAGDRGFRLVLSPFLDGG